MLVFSILQVGCNAQNQNSMSEEITIQKAVTSPNAKYIARYYTISGGGAAGYVLHFVNIQPSSRDFDKTQGNIFQFSNAKINSILWERDNVLSIDHSMDASIYLKDTHLEDIEIKYNED